MLLDHSASIELVGDIVVPSWAKDYARTLAQQRLQLQQQELQDRQLLQHLQPDREQQEGNLPRDLAEERLPDSGMQQRRHQEPQQHQQKRQLQQERGEGHAPDAAVRLRAMDEQLRELERRRQVARAGRSPSPTGVGSVPATKGEPYAYCVMQ